VTNIYETSHEAFVKSRHIFKFLWTYQLTIDFSIWLNVLKRIAAHWSTALPNGLLFIRNFKMLFWKKRKKTMHLITKKPFIKWVFLSTRTGVLCVPYSVILA